MTHAAQILAFLLLPAAVLWGCRKSKALEALSPHGASRVDTDEQASELPGIGRLAVGNYLGMAMAWVTRVLVG